MKTKKTLKKLRIKFWLLTILKFVLMIVPFVVIVCVNHQIYFTKANTWKLSIGCIIGLGIVLLVITGQEEIKKHLKGIWLFVIIFILSWCLESIAQDIVLFALCALVSEIIALIMNPYLKIAKHKIELIKDTRLQEEVKEDVRNGN